MGGRSKFLLFCFESGWRREGRGCRPPRAALSRVLRGSVVGRRARSRGTVQAKRTSSLPGVETSRSSSPRCRCWVDSDPRVSPSCPLPLPASPGRTATWTPAPSSRLALHTIFLQLSGCARLGHVFPSALMSPPSPAQGTRAAALNLDRVGGLQDPPGGVRPPP